MNRFFLTLKSILEWINRCHIPLELFFTHTEIERLIERAAIDEQFLCSLLYFCITPHK